MLDLSSSRAAAGAALICCLIAGSACAEGESWPQFRGPTGQGHAGDRPVPVSWGERSRVVWKTPLPGRGHSSPVIEGDRIWLTTASPDGKALGAVCLDRSTGAIVHSVTLFRPDRVEEIHGDNTYASPTPVLADGRLYCDFGTYGAACIDAATGEPLWKNTSLAIEHQGGPGSSPVLFEDTLIVTRDGADQTYVAALDIETGQARWRRDRSAPHRDNPITHRAFATPLLVEHEGRTVLISPGADQAHAYDAATGEELWHVTYTGFSNVPAPVAGKNLVYLCTGYFTPRLLAVRMGGSGDVTASHVAWTYKAQIPDIPSPILVGDRLYFVSNKGVLTCLDAATGERIYVHRLGGNFTASPLYAGGRLYFCNREGLTKVVQPGDEPEIVGINKLDGAILATPAAVDGALYIRTENAMYRIEDAQGDPRPQ